MLGKDLPAYVPTTALALLALHDRPTEAAVRAASPSCIGRRLAETGAWRSRDANLLACRNAAEAEDVNAAIAGEWQRSTFLGNLHVTAMALCAVTGIGSGFEAFRVRCALSRVATCKGVPSRRSRGGQACRRRRRRRTIAAQFAHAATSDVAILPASGYDADFADVIGHALQLLAVDVRGKRILLKPNLVEF